MAVAVVVVVVVGRGLATNEAWSAPLECPLMMMLPQSGAPLLVTHLPAVTGDRSRVRRS